MRRPTGKKKKKLRRGERCKTLRKKNSSRELQRGIIRRWDPTRFADRSSLTSSDEGEVLGKAGERKKIREGGILGESMVVNFFLGAASRGACGVACDLCWATAVDLLILYGWERKWALPGQPSTNTKVLGCIYKKRHVNCNPYSSMQSAAGFYHTLTIGRRE